MTKKEYGDIIANEFGITMGEFFEEVGRRPNSLGNVKLDEKVPDGYIAVMELYRYKIKASKLEKEIEKIKQLINNL